MVPCVLNFPEPHTDGGLNGERPVIRSNSSLLRLETAISKLAFVSLGAPIIDKDFRFGQYVARSVMLASVRREPSTTDTMESLLQRSGSVVIVNRCALYPSVNLVDHRRE